MHTFAQKTITTLRNRSAQISALAFVFIILFASFAYIQSSRQPTPTTLKEFYSQKLQWSSCDSKFQCADLVVPVDYSDLATGTLKISILKSPALNKQKRIGSLVVNPGGPGASGVDYAYNARYLFSKSILNYFDIVGFDPRGVSRSAPIRCFNDRQTDANYAADTKPDNQAELTQAIADSKRFIALCQAKNKFLLHFSTANAARDMDILRQALGDKHLNYMGKSYGTYMGTLYAQLFPTKVGRMVLDGAIDPAISDYQSILAQAVGFDGALDAFIDNCHSLKDCPLPKGLQASRNFIIKIFHTAAITPIPQRKPHTGDTRVATEAILVLGTASALYDSADGWPKLRTALQDIRNGYSDGFITLADEYTGRDTNGTYIDNEFDSGAVIDCLDNRDVRSPQQMFNDRTKMAAAAPIFGPYLALANLTCSLFPETPDHLDVKKKINTSRPIVIIGTTRDPATPYRWAQGLQKILTNSQLLTFVGDGHTGQGRGIDCIDNAIDAFYLSGALPQKHLLCTL